MNSSGYVGHATMLNAHYCMLFSSRVRVRIRFSVWLVNGYAHVFALLSIVIVTLPVYAVIDIGSNLFVCVFGGAISVVLNGCVTVHYVRVVFRQEAISVYTPSLL